MIKAYNREGLRIILLDFRNFDGKLKIKKDKKILSVGSYNCLLD